MVYIKEAHPADGWVSRANVRDDIVVNQPRTQEQRDDVAQRACAYLQLDLPTAVDGMDNKVGEAYEAWPDRLYVVGTNGKILYAGGKGPRGFDVVELEQFLSRHL